MRAYGNLGASEPPGLVKTFMRELFRDPQMRGWLRARGRQVAREAVQQLKGQAVAPPSPWMAAIVDPILDPFIDGVVEELKDQAAPYLSKAALVAAGGGVLLGWLIGRARRKGYTEGAAARQLPSR